MKKSNHFGHITSYLDSFSRAMVPMIDADTNAFNDYMVALKMPQATEEDKAARNKAMQGKQNVDCVGRPQFVLFSMHKKLKIHTNSLELYAHFCRTKFVSWFRLFYFSKTVYHGLKVVLVN